MRFLSPFLFATTLLLMFSSCKKDSPTSTPVDVLNVRMNDFQLQEVAYSSIQITHPTVTNGVETQQGSIEVVIPIGTTGRQLTPKTTNFTNNSFTVSPALGVINNFSSGPIVYTISSRTQTEKKVNYRVTIREEDPVQGDNLGISDLRFVPSRNSSLQNDVVASSIEWLSGTIGKIYIFLPQGTNFSSLNPTVTFSGAALYYSQDPMSAPESSNTLYPTNGQAIDLSYPRHFYLTVKRGNDFKSYEVIADVLNPLLLEANTLTLNNVIFGNTVNHTAVTRLVNVGNHAVSLKPITHASQPASTTLRAFAAFPSGGLLPGAKADVNITVNGSNNPPGAYTTTASFAPKMTFDEGTALYFTPAQLKLSTTVSN